MRITELRYAQKQNLGNYETREVEASALLSEGDDPATAWAELKRLVWAELAQPARPSATPAPTPVSAPAWQPEPPRGGTPLNPAAPRRDGTITEKQLRAVYAIARAARHLAEEEVDARCQELYHCAPADLSKGEASQFIDTLKGEGDAI